MLIQWFDSFFTKKQIMILDIFQWFYIIECIYFSPIIFFIYSPVLLIYIPPEIIRKPLGLLMFLGGIDKQHRAVMG